MSKIKLKPSLLEGVYGGKKYLKLLDFDEHQPYAFISFYRVDILFNPKSQRQIDFIKKGNPTFDGIFHLSEEDAANLRKYSVDEVLGW